jgi:MFS family permease
VSYPAGRAADRFSTRRLLAIGLGVLVLADLVLASATAPARVFAGTALWGLHMGLTQGLFSKLVADTTPAPLRGTGFGVFNVAVGGALLLASVVAGALWNSYGPQATFLASAVFAAAATTGLLMYRR